MEALPKARDARLRRVVCSLAQRLQWLYRRRVEQRRKRRLALKSALLLQMCWRVRSARAQCGRRRDMEGRAAAAVQAMVGMGHAVRGRAAARRLMDGVAIGRRRGKDGEVRHGQRGDDEEEEEEEGNEEEEEEEEEDNYTRRVRRECGAFMVQAAWWGKQARQDMLQCQCAATLIARVWRGRRQQTR